MIERFGGVLLPDWWLDRYQRLRYAKHAVRYAISALTALVLLVGAAYFTADAWKGNVYYGNALYNGDFEHGFHVQPCGIVANDWHCFTNGGAANYGFYDEQWAPVVADGYHGQLIEINTHGIGLPEHDRYAGIYQTVHVTDWEEYTLFLAGMIRTTAHEGDPWRYRVQVGWTHGPYADVYKVNNWIDVGWDTYFDRLAPDDPLKSVYFDYYSTNLIAEADYITIYIRFWKKWGVPEEEILLNLDSIELVGAYYEHYEPEPAPVIVTKPKPKPYNPPEPYYPPAPSHTVTCDGPELVYNGSFEHGFNVTGTGNVGKGWGAFTNGGAAGFGFYDEQWLPAVSDGVHSQLIEMNAKDYNPGDNDRYAGLYQRITGLQPGVTYQLSVDGLLRGVGEYPDPQRFEAQWGYLEGNDIDWNHVQNWTSMDLGTIYPRNEPGPMSTYTAQFTPQTNSVVIFLRGWKKWGVNGVDMDLNLDSISLRSCMLSGGSGYQQGAGHAYEPVDYGYDSCEYVVRPGDTLSMIAQTYNVYIHDLITINEIYNPNIVYVGQILYLPGCSPPSAPPAYHPPVVPEYRTHTVRPGETLGGICLAYGVSLDDLVRYNHIANPNWIYVGQVLKIP